MTDCKACANIGWLIQDNDTYGVQIERCDNCERYASDAEARSVEGAQAALRAFLQYK